MRTTIKYFYNKKEVLGVMTILLFIFMVSFLSFQDSLRRERDRQRILDLGALERGIIAFRNQFGEFPPSAQDGKIMACLGEDTEKIVDIVNDKATLVGLAPCEWGKNKLSDPTDDNYPPFLDLIPKDPQDHKGVIYIYSSTTDSFEIYASLEGNSEPERNEKVEERKLSCGQRICNVVRTYTLPKSQPE